MPGSPKAIRVSILPPSRPRAAMSSARVGGEPVVELEHGALQAAPVHRPDDDLALQGPSSSRSSRMSGVAEDAVDAGPGQRGRRAGRAARSGWPSPARSPRTPSAPRAGWSAATSSSRPSRRRAASSRRRAVAATASASRCGCAGAGSRSSAACVRAVSHHGSLPVGPRGGSASTSAVVGMAVEHSSLEATMAPATLANSRIRSQVPAREQPVAEGAAEGVAGAEPVDDLDGERWHLDPLVARRGQDALAVPA